MLKLGVNIDHIATLREARYRGRDRGEPDLIEAALICEAAGAHGITVHLREDRRHVQDRDVFKLREVIKTRLNLEMGNAAEIVKIALEVKPDTVCLVPEKRKELTTEGGLNVAQDWIALKHTVTLLNGSGIDVSMFVAPEPEQIIAAARAGAQYVELHTGFFSDRYNRKTERAQELQRLLTAAQLARQNRLSVNAGHGLNYINLAALMDVPCLNELNIGHSIVSRSVTVGLGTAVKEMLALMERYDK